MAKPQYYKPAPKWQVWAAFAGAVVIELAAVGFASLHFKEEEIPVDPGFVAQQPVEAMLTELPPEPTPPPEEEPPPPPPPPDEPTEFTIEEPTPPPRPPDVKQKPRARVASSRPTGPPTGPVSLISARANLTSAPRPTYPYEARRSKQTGSGKFLLHFDPGGAVTDVDVVQSTGSAILDQTSAQTFRRWRCKPGVYSKVYVPITYTLEGAQM
jgi:TonB family protein